MAQLSDDCFAFGGSLLPVEEAMRLMAAQVPPVAEVETLALASDAPVPGSRVPVLALDDIEKITDVLLIESVPIDRLDQEMERI